MSYRGRPGARHLERSPLQQQTTRVHRKAALPVPTTVSELQAQLAEIVVHESGCRWTTTRRLPVRPGEPLPQAEQRNCTCTAIPHRKHLFDLIPRTGTATPGGTS